MANTEQAPCRICGRPTLALDRICDRHSTLPPTVPAQPAKRGRKTGTKIAGSFNGWLDAARPGDVFWTERTQKSIASAASAVGRKVSLKRFYAVSDQLQAIALTHVEVLA